MRPALVACGPCYRRRRIRASSVLKPDQPKAPTTVPTIVQPDAASASGSIEAHVPRGRRRGRHTLLDPQVRETLLAAVRLGCRPSVAATYAGFSSRTLEEWMRRGRGEDRRPATPPFVELVAAIEQAHAEATVYALAQLHKAMSWSPRAAMWFLENVASEWRQRHLRDSPPPMVANERPPEPMQSPNMILVTVEQLEAIGLLQLGEGSTPLAVDDPRRCLITDFRDAE